MISTMEYTTEKFGVHLRVNQERIRSRLKDGRDERHTRRILARWLRRTLQRQFPDAVAADEGCATVMENFLNSDELGLAGRIKVVRHVQPDHREAVACWLNDPHVGTRLRVPLTNRLL